MRLFLTLLCLHCCFGELWAQDTLVFKIRKKSECVPVEVSASALPSPTLDSPKLVQVAAVPVDAYSKTPTLAKGANFWSLRWEAYEEGQEKKLLKEADYAVFDFTVDSLGLVKKINVYKYSSRAWVNSFGYELQKTVWTPAKNLEGQAVEYPFIKYIVYTLGPENSNE